MGKKASKPSNEGLAELFAELQRIEESRSLKAEKEIGKIYKTLLNDLQEFVGGEYAKYAEDDVLTYAMLQQKGQYARFLEEVRDKANGISPKIKKTITDTCEDIYKLAFDGMTNAVKLSANDKELSKILSGLKLTQPQVIKAATTNPIAKLTLSKTLEKHRKEIIYSINKTVTNGIMNGDRLTTMANRIKNEVGINYRKAMLVARTETHRVRETGHNDSAMEISNALQEADSDYRMVKIWRSMEDSKVRHTRLANHRKANGQVVLEDEEFELENGVKALCPGQSGTPYNDCNCRCYASHDLWSDDEFFQATGRHFPKTVKSNKSNTQNLDDMQIENSANNDIIKVPIETDDKAYGELLKEAKETSKIADLKYIPVTKHNEPITENEIINALSGGDQTRGSCASLGLCYIGQKQGYDVLDFRGGESQYFFSSGRKLFTLSQGKGVKTLSAKGKTSLTKANNLLKLCETGKEYYLCVGKHAAIVRRNDKGILQYLELQSADKSGWTDFNGNPRYTLSWRFGCRSTGTALYDFMIDINDSDFSNDEFRSLIGYLNTATTDQRKGTSGTIK